MDEDEKYVYKMSCVSCIGILLVFLGFWAAFIYGTVVVIDAIKS